MKRTFLIPILHGSFAILLLTVSACSKSSNNAASENTGANDSMVAVEIMPEEELSEYVDDDQYRDHSAQGSDVYPEDNEEVMEIPGMIQHTEDQGKYIPGDDDPWND